MRATRPLRRRWTGRVAVVLSLALTFGIGLGQGTASAEGIKAKMLELTNASRHRFGLPDLRMDWHLGRASVRHTEVMADTGILVHTSNVVRFIPHDWTRWGENIGYTTGALGDLQAAFMGSPAHRANILNPGFRRVGIGIVEAGGRLWVTLDFYG